MGLLDRLIQRHRIAPEKQTGGYKSVGAVVEWIPPDAPTGNVCHADHTFDTLHRGYRAHGCFHHQSRWVDLGEPFRAWVGKQTREIRERFGV